MIDRYFYAKYRQQGVFHASSVGCQLVVQLDCEEVEHLLMGRPYTGECFLAKVVRYIDIDDGNLISEANHFRFI